MGGGEEGGVWPRTEQEKGGPFLGVGFWFWEVSSRATKGWQRKLAIGLAWPALWWFLGRGRSGSGWWSHTLDTLSTPSTPFSVQPTSHVAVRRRWQEERNLARLGAEHGGSDKEYKAHKQQVGAAMRRRAKYRSRPHN